MYRFQLFVDLLKLGKNSKDALRLTNYKAPNSSNPTSANDFASVLYEVLKNRAYQNRDLSVHDVNQELDKIVVLNAQKRGVNEILLDMFQKMNATLVKWLVRLILKDMKFGGLGHNAILKAFHEDAAEMFDTNANLRKVNTGCPTPDAQKWKYVTLKQGFYSKISF